MKYQLLIVDDSSEFTQLVEMALQPQVDEGEYSLLFAQDGIEALELIATNPGIALVITDVSMPHMDGLTLLDQINAYNPHIKSIVISGHGDLQYIRRAMNAGASDYLLKPVSLEELEDSIGRATSRVDIVREALRARDTLMVYERELKIAYDIQQEMLPHGFLVGEQPPELDIEGGMYPARHVGGDFYDYFSIDEEYTGFVVGDVSGKGITAALLMTQIRTLIRSYTLQGKSASEALSLVNNMIANENKQAMFATVFLGIVHLASGVIEYCNAAHVNPLLLHLNGSVSECESTRNMAVGMVADIPFSTKHIQLLPGESIVVVTDGITEARSSQGEMFGYHRLRDSMRGHERDSSKAILQRLTGLVSDFSAGADQSDDIGILVVKYNGGSDE